MKTVKYALREHIKPAGPASLTVVVKTWRNHIRIDVKPFKCPPDLLMVGGPLSVVSASTLCLTSDGRDYRLELAPGGLDLLFDSTRSAFFFYKKMRRSLIKAGKYLSARNE